MITRTKKLTTGPLCRLTFVFVLLVTMPILSAADAAAAELAKNEAPKKILLFSSLDPTLPGTQMVTQTICATLKNNSPARVQFYQEALDNSRIPESKYTKELVSFLERKYEGEKIDLIVALGA